MTRRQSKNKQVNIAEQIKQINDALSAQGYELVLRAKPTKDVVAFDFGLIFTKDSQDVGLYVDDLLRDVLVNLASEHGQVLIKVNWFSPDVLVVTPAENPDPTQNTPVTSQEAPTAMTA